MTSSGPSRPNSRAPRQRWRVTVVEETGSTNTDLFAAALEGAPDRSVLVARHQTAGRGRLDRTWETPRGTNLLVSLLWRDPPARLHELTERVAVAVCALARGLGCGEACIKWPNDVLVGDAKLAGILAQADNSLSFVVVGVGINVGWAPPGAAKLSDVAADLTPDVVLDLLLGELDGQGPNIFEAYRALLATVQRPVTVVQQQGTWSGWAEGVDDDGRLVVSDDHGQRHTLDVADVIHVRQGMM